MGEWISVKDGLPQDRKRVLVWFSGNSALDSEPGFGVSTFFERDKYFTGSKFQGKPTHWMPLPEPPKEE